MNWTWLKQMSSHTINTWNFMKYFYPLENRPGVKNCCWFTCLHQFSWVVCVCVWLRVRRERERVRGVCMCLCVCGGFTHGLLNMVYYATIMRFLCFGGRKFIAPLERKLKEETVEREWEREKEKDIEKVAENEIEKKKRKAKRDEKDSKW